MMSDPVTFINPDLAFDVLRFDHFRDWAVLSVDIEVYKQLSFNFR